ncbi:GNAT family N-acetyltransferase [Aestuariivita boseongensis]|uniref:GNAT family N-acetyltransferase n=1 Tax=Aestuariivita boseongensis TaxID=1470562 RepID=UPI000681F016|nr:GNAT family N-acetyltransferase [Aestuariivita boseongensis]
MGLHSTPASQAVHLVKSGSFLRSDGPLSTQDVIAARQAQIGLHFDPVQNGWVRADAIDDFDALTRRPGWASLQSAAEITLRPWASEDAPMFRRLLNNPNVWTHLPNGYPGDITIEIAQELIALSAETTLHVVRAICMGGLPVGQVRLEFGEQEPELSYWLGESHWSKGIGHRAVTRFIAECFAADRTLDHMIARVRPTNIASLRILEKAGFFLEGRSNAVPDWMVLRCDRPG